MTDIRRETALEDVVAVLTISDALAADVRLLAHGGYAPLSGFMTGTDYESVVETLHLANGQVFSLPIVLPVPEAEVNHLSRGDVLEVRSVSGLRATIRVTDVFRRDLLREAREVYRTESLRHPGVKLLLSESPWCVGGPVTWHEAPASPYGEPAWPDEVKAIIESRGWNTVSAFQTRNPTHRAHEHMLKIALEVTEGLLLHPLVGPTKSDDVPADLRMASYRTLLHHYFPENRVILATFGAAMRYAGPREAVFHGLVRRNYGATHFIVGRDAAGVGDFYGVHDSRRLFESLSDEMGIVPISFDRIGFCPRCQSMASQRSCPHVDQWLSMSGTKVRELLAHGTRPPADVMRAEVADILMKE